MSEGSSETGTAGAVESAAVPNVEAAEPGQDIGGEAPQNGKAQAKPQADEPEWLQAKRKLKVNGQEREVTVKEALDRYQLAQAAHERMENASKKEKALKAREEQILNALKNDPISVFERVLGPQGARDMMERYVASKIDYDLKPPQEKERIRFEQERQQFQQQQQAYEQQQHQAQVEQQSAQYQQHFQQSFPQALQAMGLKPTQRLVGDMANVAQRLLQNGVQWTPESVAQIVAERESDFRRSSDEEYQAQLDSMSDDQLYEEFTKRFGEQRLNRFRKADVSRVRGGASKQQQQPSSQAPNTRPQAPNKFTSLDAFRDELLAMNKRST